MTNYHIYIVLDISHMTVWLAHLQYVERSEYNTISIGLYERVTIDQ
jgi:hypothetical protein